ncbi:MAG TPA: NADP-dependent oxidoreductase [Thermomicrobiales bacterium]|jgi:NADPH:quinone reductase-like Zn-dependent oxidoreductase|nr:NADP-dependent oxidoreductase [Thermomicrobiales bacterium]
MRAYALLDADSTPATVDVPMPQPGNREVLVRVEASSINGFDKSVASGRLKGMMEYQYPVVIGKDFAGTVEAVGAGVTRFAVGDAVFGVVMQPFLREGGLGEYTVVSEAYGIAAIPDGLEVTLAGAIGLAGTAALDAIAAAQITSGQTVLVSGATGGVGTIAVQYAVAAGVEVIATAQPGEAAEALRGLGATHIVDYTGDVAEQVRTIAPDGVDVVLHFAGDGVALLGVLKADGRMASTMGLSAEQDPRISGLMANTTPDTLARLAADVASGTLTVPIAATFSLDQAADAFAAFAENKVGKIAVSIAS